MLKAQKFDANVGGSAEEMKLLNVGYESMQTWQRANPIPCGKSSREAGPEIRTSV